MRPRTLRPQLEARFVRRIPYFRDRMRSLFTFRPRHAILALSITAGCTSAFELRERSPAPPECQAGTWCVSGIVVDDSRSTPLRGAQVLVTRTACVAVADSVGRFLLTCSGQPGDTLIARWIGYHTLRRAVSITPGHHYTARIRLTLVQLQGPPIVAGDSNGNPPN